MKPLRRTAMGLTVLGFGITLDLSLGERSLRLYASDLVVCTLAPLVGLTCAPNVKLRRGLGVGLIALVIAMLCSWCRPLLRGHFDAWGSTRGIIQLATWLIYFLLPLALYDPDEGVERALLLWWYFALITCVFGVLTRFASGPMATTMWWAGQRLQGLHRDPNMFAVYLGQTVVLGLTLGSKRPSWKGVILLAPVLVGLLLTQSRTGLLSTIIGVVLLLVLHGRQVCRNLSATIIVVLLVVSLLPMAPGSHLLGRLSIDSINDGLALRRELWALAWSATRESPLTGLGLGNFQWYSREHLNVETAAHSTWLGFLAETGLLGLTSVLFVLLSVIWRGFRLRREPWVACLTAMAVVALCGGVTLSLENYRAFWFVLGLIESSSVKRKNQQGGRVQ